MRVRLKVEVRAAVLARRATAGVVSVEVTDDDLRDLPEALLEEFAVVVETDAVLQGPGVRDATFASIRAALQELAETRAASRALAEQQEREGLAAAEKTAVDAAARAKDAEDRDRARTRALRAWVNEHGSDDQRARQKEGFLPDSEVVEEVTDSLFEVTEDEYEALSKGQACDCDRGCAGSVRFTISTTGFTMDSRQYAVLEKVRETAPSGSTVTPRMHKAACPECKCTPIARMSALVTLPWCGWLLTKEYSLG